MAITTTNAFVPTAVTLLLLLLSFPPTSMAGGPESEVVLDMSGNPLEVGSEYYMSRPIFIFGGIKRAPKPGQICPLYAIEAPFETDPGQPLKFIPENESDNHIKLTSRVQIDSGLSPMCRDDGIWRVDHDVVIASGVDVPRSWFSFERVGGSIPTYTIVYCPPNGPPLLLCSHLGVSTDANSGLKVLAPTIYPNDAVAFGFMKKSDSGLITM